MSSRLFILFAISLLLIGCTMIGQQPSTGQGPSQSSGTGTQQAQPPAQNASSGQTQTQTQTQAQQNQTPATTTSLTSEEVSYNAGAWKIYGTLYESQSETPNKAIILIPQLGKTRDSYPASFVESLHNTFPEAVVLAIDPRGSGKSTNLGTYQSFDSETYKSMKTDILSSFKNLFEPRYPDVDEYYLVGASIGSTSAINAAGQDDKITKVVAISPGMDYQGVDITSSVKDYRHPILLVASSGDADSAQAVTQIKSLSSDPETESKTYSGSAHGTDLFDATKDSGDPLSARIVEFLK